MNACVTELLRRWQEGDEAALEELAPVVYGELHRLARARLRRERAGHTLGATALVHEAYLRLAEQRAVSFENRAHFYGVAGRMMRRLLVDHARRRRAQKRAGNMGPTPEARDAALVRLDEAVERLATLDARRARIVELRYFAGLTIEETADVLDASAASIKREWALARAFLQRELAGGA